MSKLTAGVPSGIGVADHNVKFPHFAKPSEAQAVRDVRRRIHPEKQPRLTDVTVILGIIGQVEGNVFYSMTERTAIGLAERMMNEPFESFIELAQSGIAELGNVITGRASVKLSHNGYESTISAPTMLLGKGATISTPDFLRLVLPLNSECGSLGIHLALREGIQSHLKMAREETRFLAKHSAA